MDSIGWITTGQGEVDFKDFIPNGSISNNRTTTGSVIQEFCSVWYVEFKKEI